MIFQYRKTAEVKESYFFYRAGVRVCIECAGGDVEPQQVMDAILAEKVHVYDLFCPDEGLIGFVVMNEFENLYTGAFTLHVDFATLMSKAPRTLEFYEEIVNFAQDLGFDRIEFRSERKGWKRYAKATGFNIGATVYSKEI